MSNNEHNPYKEIQHFQNKRKFQTPSPGAPRRASRSRQYRNSPLFSQGSQGHSLLSSSSAQMPHLRAPVARSPVQIFTSPQEARQSAQQGNIVIQSFISITPSYINRFSAYQPVQVSNMFGGRRSRKRNNKKRNIKTKKQYQS